ncbi:MAG: DUF1573 domain-containing protein [Bacteroidota bacterium]
MKAVFFIVASIISSAAFGQGALISWDKSNYDFGDIRQGEKVEYTFKFHNVGSEPLMITNVTTQCAARLRRVGRAIRFNPEVAARSPWSSTAPENSAALIKWQTVMSNAINKDATQVFALRKHHGEEVNESVKSALPIQPGNKHRQLVLRSRRVKK